MNDPQAEGHMASHLERRKFLSHAQRRSGGVPARRRRLVGDSWNNDRDMRRECMRCQSSFAFIPLMILPLVTIAKADDASKYPNLKGQWTVIITPGLEGQAVKFDPTKPWGRGQQAPLTSSARKTTTWARTDF